MKISRTFVKVLLILSLLIILLNFAGLAFNFYNPWFGYALIGFGFMWVFLIFRKKEAGFWFELPKYIFLFLLLIVTISSLKFEFINKIAFMKAFIDFLKGYQLWLTIITIAFGALTFWMNKDVVENGIEKEKEDEESAEKRRLSEFDKKFPRLKWFDLDYGIRKAWKEKRYAVAVLRTLVSPFVWLARLPYIVGKWMHKEGWWFSLGLMMIVILAFFIFSYHLGSYDFQSDEYQVVGAAAGYYYTGHFYSWDWLNNKPICNDLSNDSCVYTRAWPHSFLIAQSYKIFGISEWSSRIVSVLFGLIFIISTYFITRYFTESKFVSLLTIFIFTFNLSFINLFRYVRMYAVLLPIFLILFYLFYRGITEKNKIHFKPERLNNFINKNLNFNYLFLFFALILLYLNYLIHINSLIILPVLFLFIIYLAIFKRERKYIICSLIGLWGSLIVFLTYYFGLTTKFTGFLSFFGRKNYVYLEYLTQFPFFKEMGVLLLSIGLILLFINKERRDKLMYFYLTIGFSLVFFIWIADRYAGYVYISHIVVISMILIIFVYYSLVRCFNKKIIKIVLYFLLIFFLCLSFYNGFDGIYKNENSNGRFNGAYATIKENFNSEEQVIFGQYLRTYYLQGLPDNTLIIDMRSNSNYTYEEFYNDLSNSSSGWLTWETRKSYHIQSQIIKYIDANFKKYHGNGIDNTNVEVYYFNKSMIK